MSPRSGAAGLAIAAGLASLAPGTARAQDPEPIRVVVEGDGTCADAASFARQITGRTDLARVVSSGEARAFTARFAWGPAGAHGGRVTGALVITSAGRATEQRRVEGPCDEVLAALGLVAALAIDPHAKTVSRLPDPPPRPDPPPLAPRPLPPLPPPRPFDRFPWWAILGEPLPVIPEPEAARWRWGFGLEVAGETAVGPSLVPAIEGFVDLERATTGLLAPAFRLGFVGAPGATRSVSATDAASFRVLAGRVEGCPIRAAISAWLSASPCLRFEAGVREASGVARVSLASTRPWVTPGLTGRLGVEAPRFRFVRLELEAGVTFPAVRDSFSFGPPSMAQQAFATPAAGGLFGAAVSAHFP